MAGQKRNYLPLSEPSQHNLGSLAPTDIMDLQTKTPRKRVANFTADEKVLLAQIIKKRPIVESKFTDGKSIAKKQAAWELITQEFNSNAHVNKRETISLKRAWDNMKAFTRKARAEERGNLIRTGGGPHAPPPPPQNGGIISMVEEAAPAMICEIRNEFDSDGAILNAIANEEQMDFIIENGNEQSSILIETIDIFDTKKKNDIEEDMNIEVQDNYESISTDCTGKNDAVENKATGQVRRPTDYIRREAVIRIKHLENKKKMEMLILKTQLEVQQIKKKAALLEEETNRMLFEKAKIELEEIRNKNK